MGWENLDSISSDLIIGGCNVDTPAALIHRGTEPNQQTVVGTLSNISEKGRAAGLSAPVILIIGNVMEENQSEYKFFLRKVLSCSIKIIIDSSGSHIYYTAYSGLSLVISRSSMRRPSRMYLGRWNSPW